MWADDSRGRIYYEKVPAKRTLLTMLGSNPPAAMMLLRGGCCGGAKIPFLTFTRDQRKIRRLSIFSWLASQDSRVLYGIHMLIAPAVWNRAQCFCGDQVSLLSVPPFTANPSPPREARATPLLLCLQAAGERQTCSRPTDTTKSVCSLDTVVLNC